MITQQTLVYEDVKDELAFLSGAIQALDQGRIIDARLMLQLRHMDLQDKAAPKLVPYDPRAEA